jgi:hypothetical protein
MTPDEVREFLREANVHLGVGSAYEDLAKQLQPGERITAALKTRSVLIDGQKVEGQFPLAILTSHRLIIVQTIRGALEANITYLPLALEGASVSPYEKDTFVVTLGNGTSVKIRRPIGFNDVKKPALRLYEALKAAT